MGAPLKLTKASGAQRDRSALKAAVEYMRKGDTLVVLEIRPLWSVSPEAYRLA